MGMSASQARFLQLTARKSDIEYQAQRINFERLKLADQLSAASTDYNDKLSNRKLTFSFNNGNGESTVDITYKNYKNYMNKQLEGITSSQQKLFLVSSSGKKIIVSSEDEMREMMKKNPRELEFDESGNPIDNQGSIFSEDDFMICKNLDDNDKFMQALESGVYYFATLEKTDSANSQEDGNFYFKTQGLDDTGSIRSELDKSDDAQAQAEYERISTKIEKQDKIMQMELDRLEAQRSAITTEMDSVSKVIEDNIDKTFKIFG